jgi:hypothetical protein
MLESQGAAAHKRGRTEDTERPCSAGGVLKKNVLSHNRQPCTSTTGSNYKKQCANLGCKNTANSHCSLQLQMCSRCCAASTTNRGCSSCRQKQQHKDTR